MRRRPTHRPPPTLETSPVLTAALAPSREIPNVRATATEFVPENFLPRYEPRTVVLSACHGYG